MVTRTVHQFNSPIQVGPGERVRHEVTFMGASAAFAITSVPPGALLLNQDDPGPPWRRDWRQEGDPLDANPVQAIAMAFVQATQYRWRVFHIDTTGNASLEVDVEYSSTEPTDTSNDAIAILG